METMKQLQWLWSWWSPFPLLGICLEFGRPFAAKLVCQHRIKHRIHGCSLYSWGCINLGWFKIRFPQTWKRYFCFFSPQTNVHPENQYSWEEGNLPTPTSWQGLCLFRGVWPVSCDQGAVRGGRCHPKHHPCGTVDVAGLGPTGSVTQSRVKLDGF